MWTHYHAETQTAFELGYCEVCDGEVQEPNSVTILGGSFLKTLQVVADLPPEIYWDDDYESTACEGCIEHKAAILLPPEDLTYAETWNAFFS